MTSARGVWPQQETRQLALCRPPAHALTTLTRSVSEADHPLTFPSTLFQKRWPRGHLWTPKGNEAVAAPQLPTVDHGLLPLSQKGQSLPQTLVIPISPGLGNHLCLRITARDQPHLMPTCELGSH